MLYKLTQILFGSVSPGNSISVNPSETVTYTLTTINDAGSVDATTVVSVNKEVGSLPTIDFYPFTPVDKSS